MSAPSAAPPEKILVETADGEYIAATLLAPQPGDVSPACIYRQTEYYHELSSALRDEFGVEPKGEA